MSPSIRILIPERNRGDAMGLSIVEDNELRDQG